MYRSINRTIDAYIEKQNISAPSEADYAPPWEPETEPEALDLRGSGHQRDRVLRRFCL